MFAVVTGHIRDQILTSTFKWTPTLLGKRNMELNNQHGAMSEDLYFFYLSQYFLSLYPLLFLGIVSILTFIMVELHTGTNFPAVSLNSLLAAVMMTHTERWNLTGAPTQSIPQAASFTLSAYDN